MQLKVLVIQKALHDIGYCGPPSPKDICHFKHFDREDTFQILFLKPYITYKDLW